MKTSAFRAVKRACMGADQNSQSPDPAPRNRWAPLPLALTRTGLIYILVCAFVCIAAINSQVNLLYLAFGMFVGGFFVSIFLAALSLQKIELHREFAEPVVAGEPTPVEYRLANGKRFCPVMALHVREMSANVLDP